MRHPLSAVALIRGAVPATRTLTDAEENRLAEQLGHPRRVEPRAPIVPAAHYSVGDYLKYEPDA